MWHAYIYNGGQKNLGLGEKALPNNCYVELFVWGWTEMTANIINLGI